MPQRYLCDPKPLALETFLAGVERARTVLGRITQSYIPEREQIGCL
jgi:hypothetical protein